MKKLIYLFFCVALASGCKINDQESDHPLVELPDRLPDAVTESGIFVYMELENHEIQTDEDREFISQHIENNWLYVQDCLGMYSDDPPSAIVVEDVSDWLAERGIGVNDAVTGHARYKENIILIEYRFLFSDNKWKHELIHIVLHQNQIPEILNSNHKPDYIWNCELPS